MYFQDVSICLSYPIILHLHHNKNQNKIRFTIITRRAINCYYEEDEILQSENSVVRCGKPKNIVEQGSERKVAAVGTRCEACTRRKTSFSPSRPSTFLVYNNKRGVRVLETCDSFASRKSTIVHYFCHRIAMHS